MEKPFNEEAAALMSRTRTTLLLDFPWFGMLAMRMNMEQRSDIPTFATDGTNLFYNPEFALKQERRSLVGIMAHELLHCCLLHPWRRGARDPFLWNVATDHAINLSLKEAGIPMPPGCLCDPQYRNLSAEVIYAKLPKNPDSGQDQQPQPTGTVEDAPKQGQPQPSKGDGDKEGEGSGPARTKPMTEEDWKIAAQQATMVTKAAGKTPDGASRAAKLAGESKLDWKAILREFIEHTVPHDYSWSTPNRRHIANGLYLPGIVKENTAKIAVVVDTSGSIDQKALNAFTAELNSIIQETRPDSTLVVYCDAKVQATQEFTPDEPIVMKPAGGGGTAFQPAFDYLNKLDEQPTACMYFTDLENGREKVQEPGYPTLWVTSIKTTLKQPFGQIIRIDTF